MTSAINPGTINANYPVPGENNSSQGFRDNFLATRNNFSNAALEISELQATAVLKAGLGTNGAAPDNDMANTLISNALTLGFRQTTYNLGTNLLGGVAVNATNGDYQFGTLSGNVALSFSGWAPAGTYSEITVSLNVVNSNNYIYLPGSVLGDSVLTVENYDPINGTINAPANVTQLTYVFSTTDCGQTVEVRPLDRPRRAQQVVTRGGNVGNVFPLVGQPGDEIGSVVYSTAFTNRGLLVCTGNYNGTTNIWQVVGSNGGGSGATGNSISNGTSNISFSGANGNIIMAVANSNVVTITNSAANTVSVKGSLTATGTITAANIITTGTGPVNITSASTITMTGANSSNVILANGTSLNVTGNTYLSTNIVTPGVTSGVAGQIVVDITNNKIWVCYGGTNWKSATLS